MTNTDASIFTGGWIEGSLSTFAEKFGAKHLQPEIDVVTGKTVSRITMGDGTTVKVTVEVEEG